MLYLLRNLRLTTERNFVMFRIKTEKETKRLLDESCLTAGLGKYPWRKLEVGQSFHIPRNQMSRENYRPRPPLKLLEQGYRVKTMCSVDDDGVIGTLVYRVA